MKRFVLTHVLAVLALTACALVGCGKESRCAISGVVTSEGEPVPTGNINFIPENPDPTKGVVGAGAEIVDGQYSIPPGPNALLPGKYRVVVIATVTRDKQGNIVSGDDLKEGKVDSLSCTYEDLVPPKFGSKSEQYVEVGNAKTMTYDIHMVKE